MSEPEVLGLCVIVPPMDAMCASGRSCCAAALYPTRSLLRTRTTKCFGSKMNFSLPLPSPSAFALKPSIQAAELSLDY